MSLSARRAWIEMYNVKNAVYDRDVALRKESVDRNEQMARAAYDGFTVALRKESVDRNHLIVS